MSLFDAIRNNDIAYIRAVNKDVLDIHDDSEEGNTPLQHAIMLGKNDIVEILLQRGASVRLDNYKAQSPLELAALANNATAVTSLLDRGADVHHVSIVGNTPLHSAARAGNVEILHKLIASGAEIDKVDKNHETALHYAAMNSKNDAIQTLLAHGANRKLFNNFGARALDYSFSLKDDLSLIAFGYKNPQAHPDYGKRNISQTYINEKLIKYCRLKGYSLDFLELKADPQGILQDEGQCYGWAFLFAYYQSIGHPQEFWKILDYISSWDENLESLSAKDDLQINEINHAKKAENRYKDGDDLLFKLINDLTLFQSTEAGKLIDSPNSADDRLKQWAIVGDGLHLQNIFNLQATDFPIDQFSELLKFSSQWPDTFLDIGISREMEEYSHAISIYNGKIYYDSNLEFKMPLMQNSMQAQEFLQTSLSVFSKLSQAQFLMKLFWGALKVNISSVALYKLTPPGTEPSNVTQPEIEIVENYGAQLIGKALLVEAVNNNQRDLTFMLLRKGAAIHLIQGSLETKTLLAWTEKEDYQLFKLINTGADNVHFPMVAKNWFVDKDYSQLKQMRDQFAKHAANLDSMFFQINELISELDYDPRKSYAHIGQIKELINTFNDEIKIVEHEIKEIPHITVENVPRKDKYADVFKNILKMKLNDVNDLNATLKSRVAEFENKAPLIFSQTKTTQPKTPAATKTPKI